MDPRISKLLLIYGNSLCFPRKAQHVGECFASILSLSEKDTIVLNRGIPASTIKDQNDLFQKDIGYFTEESALKVFALFVTGHVDSAPRPITYFLRHFIKRIPKLGPRLWRVVYANRPFIQRFCWYRQLSPTEFKSELVRTSRIALSAGIEPIYVNMAMPPEKFRQRSPHWHASIEIYNLLLGETREFYHIRWTDEDVLDADGHHLSAKGHHKLASTVRAIINSEH